MASIDNERQLKLGEVKTIRSNNGKQLEEAELLFSSTTIAKFVVDRETNKLNFQIDNTDFKYQDLECSLDKNTIRNIYIVFRDLYNELTDESEEVK